MNAKVPLLIACFGMVALDSGCTFPSRKTIYDRNAAGRSMAVESGEVIGVRDVQISGRNTIIGVGGGGLVGNAAGSGIGKGAGSTIASAAGAVGGAIMGEAVEEAATRRNAQEITIKLHSGDTIAVVQEVKAEGAFNVGEQVQVLQGMGISTVRRLN
jgi:outer membrane lipoprotein SlyB